MSRLRLDLIVRRYPTPTKITTESRSVGGFGTISGTYEPQPDVDRWTWRLWSGSRVVASSGAQLYSRRVDCVNGAAIACNVWNLLDAARSGDPVAFRPLLGGHREDVEVRLIDERASA